VKSVLNGRVIIGAKGKLTDAGNHVPFIANWPGIIPAGKVNRDLIDFSDFLPTVCETASVAIPTRFKIDGQSLLPQLRGMKGNPRKWTYCW